MQVGPSTPPGPVCSCRAPGTETPVDPAKTIPRIGCLPDSAGYSHACGRNPFRSAIVSLLVFAFGSGVIQLPGLTVEAATKPKTAGVSYTPNQLSVKPIEALAPVDTMSYLVSLGNVSKSSCTLEGYPQLRMLDAGGKSIATRVTHRSAIAGANATRVTLVTVKPGWSGLFGLTYPNSLLVPKCIFANPIGGYPDEIWLVRRV